MNKKEIFVTKLNGVKELFNEDKLKRSLINSGATIEVADKVVAHISKELKDGIPTSSIRERALSLFARTAKPASARYSLKKALAELGPSGFPFEKFVADIFRARGYHAENNQFIKGKCVEHEIDVVAWNDNELVMAEAKFHNELGLKSDLKVALYVKARFDDISNSEFFYGRNRKLDEGLLITNTKFTEKAISYATCSGLKIIGWNYPAKGNLHDLIEETAMHPVTSLSSLSPNEKKNLIEAGIILCRDLKNEPLLRTLGLNDKKVEEVIEERDSICPTRNF